MYLDVPDPDYDGIEQYFKHKYTVDRMSELVVDDEPEPYLGKVSVYSGEHPSYTRFIKDLRPIFHEYGFVMSYAQEDYFVGIDPDKDAIRRHKVSGIPMIWPVLLANGYICKRGACRKVRKPDSPYCEGCDGEIMADQDEFAVIMTHP